MCTDKQLWALHTLFFKYPQYFIGMCVFTIHISHSTVEAYTTFRIALTIQVALSHPDKYISQRINIYLNGMECLLFARNEEKKTNKVKKSIAKDSGEKAEKKKKWNQTEKMERAVNQLKHTPFTHEFDTSRSQEHRVTHVIQLYIKYAHAVRDQI